jgi:hypothetical protein
MRVLLIGDSPASRSCCSSLAAALSVEEVEVFDDLHLTPEALSTSDLPMGMDAIGLFIAAERVPLFLERFRQACRMRQQGPIPVFTGATLPLTGDALAADLLPRLGADLLCVHGPRQLEELVDLLRTIGLPGPPTLLTGPWGLPSPPPLPQAQTPVERPRRLLFLEQSNLPPAPGARLRLLEVLERLCINSPRWEVVVQPSEEAGGPAEPGVDGDLALDGDSGPSLASLLLQRPSPPANLLLNDPADWPSCLSGAGVCATISSPLLWEALAHGVPLLLLGDYGIRSDLDGPLLFGSGLMGRLTTCEHLDALLDLPTPNAGWLRELGWEIGDGAHRLKQTLLEFRAR